jgi:hypothetical protein
MRFRWAPERKNNNNKRKIILAPTGYELRYLCAPIQLVTIVLTDYATSGLRLCMLNCWTVIVKVIVKVTRWRCFPSFHPYSRGKGGRVCHSVVCQCHRVTNQRTILMSIVSDYPLFTAARRGRGKQYRSSSFFIRLVCGHVFLFVRLKVDVFYINLRA